VRFTLAAALLLLTTITHAAEPRRVIVREIEGAAPAGAIEIRGVGAGPFDPAMWEAGKLHLLPDVRSPLLEPREGKFRNIYAPSIAAAKDGWEIYYGGWDGAPTGNDRIYRVNTRDFLTFGDRRTIIEHGDFQHVCNVSATRLPGGALAMMCTAFPDAKGFNKPAFFPDPDADAPRVAMRDDIISIAGYPAYADADINGMNVLLHENGPFRLYFCNFRDGGKVFRASGEDGKHFTFDGVALASGGLVNDVKKFRIGDASWYLMALHHNGDRLWYALSRDGRSFAPQRVLCTRQGEADAFMVAVGFVVSGEQEKPRRRVLGILYGAGAKPSLDANRIFARWLQKRVVLTAGDDLYESSQARGPDAQIVRLPRDVTAPLELYAEDGVTLIGRSDSTRFEPAKAYVIRIE
jgi:hypothetical protein